jgi:hypothetical protein
MRSAAKARFQLFPDACHVYSLADFFPENPTLEARHGRTAIPSVCGRVIEPKFPWAEELSEGLARVKIGLRYVMSFADSADKKTLSHAFV